MKAILIDPFERTIDQIEYNDDIEEIYRLIRCESKIFTVVNFSSNGDGVYVDDEGRFVSNQAFFSIEGYPQPLAGRGLVLGCDSHGNSTTPKHSFQDICGMVTFYG